MSTLRVVRHLQNVLSLQGTVPAASRANVAPDRSPLTPNTSLPSQLTANKAGREMGMESLQPNFSIIVEMAISVHSDLLLPIPYFAGLFNSGMREVTDRTLRLKDLDYKAVKAVIDYMYGEEVHIKWDEINDVLEVADRWLVENMKDDIEDFIINNTNCENCIDIFFLDDKYRIARAMNHSQRMTYNNIECETVYSKAIQLDLWALKELLSDMLSSVSCDTIVKFCIEWVLYDEHTRREEFVDLVDHIGLSRCSEEFLQLVRKIYRRSLHDNEVVSPYLDLLRPNPTPDQPGDPHIAEEDRIDSYDVMTSLVPDAFIGLHPSWCRTPCGLFSCGGIRANHREGVGCGLLDEASMAYVCLPNSPVPVFSGKLSCLDDKIFVNGGDWERNKDIMYCFDLKRLSWSRILIKNLPNTLSFISGFVL